MPGTGNETWPCSEPVASMSNSMTSGTPPNAPARAVRTIGAWSGR